MGNDASPGKSWGLFLTLLLIVGLSAANLIWPRQSNVSNETIQVVKATTDQLQRVADSFDKNTKAMTDLKESLTHQVREREISDDQGYDELLKKWGLGMDTPANIAADDQRLLERANAVGGGYLFTGPGGTGPARKHLETSPSVKGAADGNNANPPPVRQGNAGQPAE